MAPYFATYTGADLYIVLRRTDFTDNGLHFECFAPNYEAGKAIAAQMNLGHAVGDLTDALDNLNTSDPYPEQITAVRAASTTLDSLLWELEYDSRRAEREAEAAKRAEAMAALAITDEDMDALKRVIADRQAALAENEAATTAAAAD